MAGTTATDDIVTSYEGGTLKVTAGRVTTLDLGMPVLDVISDPAGGNATVNPDGTVALVLPDPQETGAMSFSVVVQGNGGPRTVTVPLNVVDGPLSGGWGSGDFYTLATDANDMTVVEAGENHRKIYVSESAAALSRADIAAREGIAESKITGAWLRDHPEYGGSEGMAIDTGAAMTLWYETTGDGTEPSSDWLLFERGYTYENTGRLVDRGAEGESALHPLVIGAWGEGDRPVIEDRITVYALKSENIVVQGVELADGMGALWGENFLLDDVVLTGRTSTVSNQDRFTLRGSQVIDTLEGGNGSGFFTDKMDGLLIENVLSDHNGWVDGYEDGAGRAPSKFDHNFYIQFTTHDVTFRENVSMQAAATGAQIRAGAVVENNVFLDNNSQVFVSNGIEHDGNYSLLLDNVATLAGYKEVFDGSGGALAQGIVVDSELAVLLGNIVAHLSDPTDAEALAYRTTIHEAIKAGKALVDDTIVYNWVTERERWKEDGINQNLPDIARENLDGVTVKSFVETVLGLDGGDADGVAELSAYLRAEWRDGKSHADDLVEFFQKGFGIDVTNPGHPQAMRFVPDSRADGMRWDVRLNWAPEYLPEDGDSVDLGGNWVTYSGTTSLKALQLGDGGVLTARQGYLRIDDLDTGADGAIRVGLAGQVWTSGYDGAGRLDVSVDGGRFANTGVFTGPADLDVSGGEVLLATAGARFELDGRLSISGTDARIGFDGAGGGGAAFLLDDGAELSFQASADGISAIREFRSGHWGTAAPDVSSRVDLGDGDTTLSLDLGALGFLSGTTRYTLASADAVTGGFGAMSVSGIAQARVGVHVDYAADLVELVISSAGAGGTLPTLELGGSAAVDVFHVAAGAATTIRAHDSQDIIDVSAVAGAGDLSGFRLRAAGDDAELVLGNTVMARLVDGWNSVTVRADGVSTLLTGAFPPSSSNADPVAGAGQAAGAADGTLSGRAQATDADGDALTYALAQGPDRGEVTMAADGSFTFDPQGAFFDTLPLGTEWTGSFTYSVSDGRGGSDTGTVTLRVEGRYAPDPEPNADPVAGAGQAAGAADGTLSGRAQATDADGDALTYALAQGPDRGEVTMAADGSFTFDPQGAFFDTLPLGTEWTGSFTYSVSDGHGGSDTGTVALRVEGRYAPDPDPVPEPKPNMISGTAAADVVHGTAGADVIRTGAGSYDRVWGHGDSDAFVFGAEAKDGTRSTDWVFDFDADDDVLVLEAGAEIDFVARRGGNLWITLEGDSDIIILSTDAAGLDGISLIHDEGVWLA